MISLQFGLVVRLFEQSKALIQYELCRIRLACFFLNAWNSMLINVINDGTKIFVGEADWSDGIQVRN